MVTPLPSNILVQDSNGTVVRARVQNPLVSDWNPKIVLPLVFPDPDVISATVVNAGTLFAGGGSAAAPSIAFASDPDTGFYKVAGNQLHFAAGGVAQLRFYNPGTIQSVSGGGFLQLDGAGAASLTASGTNQNITLTPSGTGTVVVSASITPTAGGRNIGAGPGSTQRFATVYAEIINSGSTAFGLQLGTGAAQPITFNAGASFTEQARMTDTGIWLFGTATNSSNGRLQLATHTTSAGGIGFGTDVSVFRPVAGGLRISGTQTSFGIETFTAGYVGLNNDSAGGSSLRLYSDGTLRLRTNSADALTLDTFQNATFGSAVSCAATQSFNIGNRGGIFASADGVFRFQNNAGTDFSRLQFGGTTSSFPALRRNTTVLEAVLADSSDFANFTAKEFSVYGGCRLSNSSDGVLLLSNNAKTGFSRLQFGGTTSSFPALKRNGADVEIRNGDDTAYTRIYSAQQRLTGAAGTAAAGQVELGGTTATTVGAAGGASALPATPLGYILINVAGTAAKIPYYNN